MRLDHRTARDGPGEDLRRAPQGDRAVARPDVQRRLWRRLRPHRLPVYRPHSYSRGLGTGLSAGLGPAAPMDRPDPVRGPAAVRRSACAAGSATANNRVAADDFPYPLSGTWGNGFRAVRVRQMLEAQPKFRRQDFARMHQDSASLRAVDCVPRLLNVLQEAVESDLVRRGSPTLVRGGSPDPAARWPAGLPQTTPALPPEGDLRSDRCGSVRRPATTAVGDRTQPSEVLHQVCQAIEHLAVWDCRMEPDRVAASIFNVFFGEWCERVAEERFRGRHGDTGLRHNRRTGERSARRGPAGWFAETASATDSGGDAGDSRRPRSSNRF